MSDKIMQGFRAFKNKVREEGLMIAPGPFAALAFRAYCTGWRDRKVADTTEVHISAVDTRPGEAAMNLEEAHAAWNQRQDFNQINRRQASKIGFFAGWHSRKLAEFKLALGLRGNYASFRRAWADGADREKRNMEATCAALEGRNWFTDSTGRTWVDAHDELAAQWAAGDLKLTDPAEDFLSEQLRYGMRIPTSIIQRNAAEMGFSMSRIRRTADRMGIRAERLPGELPIWTWQLPPENDFEGGLDAGIPIG